jgi:hypothetical protein
MTHVLCAMRDGAVNHQMPEGRLASTDLTLLIVLQVSESNHQATINPLPAQACWSPTPRAPFPTP